MLLIDNHSTIPIYEQIVEQLKIQILNGTLEAQTALPSIRALAKDLNISVITTKRAYSELEHLGLIETLPGKGSFVSGQKGFAKEQLLIQMEEHISQAIKLAKQVDLSKKELIDLTKLYWED